MADRNTKSMWRTGPEKFVRKTKPPGEWHLYAMMTQREAREFMKNVIALEPGRTMFEYKIDQ